MHAAVHRDSRAAALVAPREVHDASGGGGSLAHTGGAPLTTTKDAELLAAAHRQLGGTLDAARRLEVSHAQVIAAKDAALAALQRQLDAARAASDAAAAEHESQRARLMNSLQQLQETCSEQARQLLDSSSRERQLLEERHEALSLLRERDTALGALQVRKAALT